MGSPAKGPPFSLCKGTRSGGKGGETREGRKCKSGGEEIQKYIISFYFFFYKCKLDI